MMALTDAHRNTLVQFIKFGIVGGVGFVFDNALVYFGIYVLGLSRVAAGYFSFPFVVSLTWAGNRFFTYREMAHEPMRKQLIKFMLVCAIGLVFNRGTYNLVEAYLPPSIYAPFVGLLAGTGVGMFFNFFVTRKLVFRAN